MPVGGPARGDVADAGRDFCQGKIAHYKVPRCLKVTDEFPMTLMGKVQKSTMLRMSAVEFGLVSAAGVETA